MGDVEGRWTIYVCSICGHAGSTDLCAGPRAPHDLAGRPAVPVVPCDDAAVERAAKAYAAFRTPTIGWHPETDSYAVYVYTDASETRVVESGFTSTTAAARAIPRLGAEAVLRAAGGQE